MSNNKKDGVSINTSIDLPGAVGRLEGIARQIFENSAVEMQRAIKEQWRGWKYKGRNLATTGASQAGWKYTLQTVEGGQPSIVFTNTAKTLPPKKSSSKTREPYEYAGYVARSKGATPEWEIARDMLIADYLPDLQSAMAQAIRDALTTTGSYRQVRENRASVTSEITLEI